MLSSWEVTKHAPFVDACILHDGHHETTQNAFHIKRASEATPEAS